MVFISLDKTEEAFLDFYKSMPWLAVPYANTEARDGLIKALGVTSAPGLYIVGSDGVVINPTGLKPFMSDKTGDGFPWHPPPYCELMLAQEAVNEEPTLIAFVEGCSKDVSEEVERALKAKATAKGLIILGSMISIVGYHDFLCPISSTRRKSGAKCKVIYHLDGPDCLCHPA